MANDIGLVTIQDALKTVQSGLTAQDAPGSNQTVMLHDQTGAPVAKAPVVQTPEGEGQMYFERTWNLTTSTTVAAAWGGNLALGQRPEDYLGLGCYLVTNDHQREKLMPGDHYHLAKGGVAKLDGSMGHYQFGWGKPFYLNLLMQGGMMTLGFSFKKRVGYKNFYVPVATDSAAGWATIERSTGRLVSYINEGADYRGGNNTSAYDGKYNSLLGRPVSSMTTNAFLNAAHLNGDGWLGSCGRFCAVEAILFYIIFGNLNAQAAFNPNRDVNGLRQGGLGTGPTNAGAWWSKAVDEGGFGYLPVIPMSAGIELGDACGVFTYDVKDTDGNVLQTMQCTSFFGHKNALGGIMWRMMTDELLRNNSDGSQTHLIAEKIKKVSDAYTYSIGDSAAGFIEGATGPTYAEAGWNYVTRIAIGSVLELFPTAVGGDSDTRFADGYYNPPATSGFRLVLRSGLLNLGGFGGPALVYGNNGVGVAHAYYGSSLCEVDEEWPVDEAA